MKREKGNYKLPIPLTSGEVRVFSLQGNRSSNLKSRYNLISIL